MKTLILIVLVPLLSGLLTAPHARAQDGHAHHAHAVAGTPSVAPQPGHRWESDPSLRIGMARIRTAVDALKHYELGHMGQEQAVMFADDIQRQIIYLVANCKLEPKADAALHTIIAELGAAAQSLKADPDDPSVIASMRAAVERYPRQFDDPTWAGTGEIEEVR